MMRGSLLDLLRTVAEGGALTSGVSEAMDGAAVSTVVASGGYPGPYEKGKTISIPSDLESHDCLIFHAGTRSDGGPLVTAGGRVLAVTALAPTLAEAADASRSGADRITFEGAFSRTDIGWRERLRQERS